jgi:hypothetical protein
VDYLADGWRLILLAAQWLSSLTTLTTIDPKRSGFLRGDYPAIAPKASED